MTYSRLANIRETRAVLERFGLATKHRLGQNFLVNDEVIGRIVELADLGCDDVVLEVGPGIGTLTVAMLARVRAVFDALDVPRLTEQQISLRFDRALATLDGLNVPDARKEPLREYARSLMGRRK